MHTPFPYQTPHCWNRLQVGQVIFDFLFAEFPESWANSVLHTFIAQEVVRRIADDADFDCVSVHLAFDGLLESEQRNMNSILQSQ